jgi:UDP-3-O-[3-hydroxymyristoyl] glucosamine N-acyltransferase
LKLQDIADRLQCTLDGDGDVDIVGIAAVHKAGPGYLTFVASSRYLPKLATTRASAVILGRGTGRASPVNCAVLYADDPYSAFANAVTLFAPDTRPIAGVDPMSAIASDASIGDGASIGAFVTIGPGAVIGARTVIHPNVAIGAGVRIGDDCVIHSQTSIRDRVVLGDRVTLHDGAVIGSDGYGFARQKDGTHLKIPQHGDVVIEDDVEIGANVTVDRPAIGETRIGAGTKIDNLVHVAHGVAIGRRVLLAAQVGIAGSATIGDDVMMAGQTGITGHITVGDKVIVGAKSAVLQSVEPGTFVTGSPAFAHGDWRKASVVFRQLPSMKKRLEDLEQRIAELEQKLAACQADTEG